MAVHWVSAAQSLFSGNEKHPIEWRPGRGFEKGILDSWIWSARAMHIFSLRGSKEALWQSHKDWLWWFSPCCYLMRTVTCFVLQLAHLPARREDKAFRIWLKRFVFGTFKLPLTWRRSPHLPHSVPIQEWRGSSSKHEKKEMACFTVYVHDVPVTIKVNAEAFGENVS